jgi:serine/threonine-protein kinase
MCAQQKAENLAAKALDESSAQSALGRVQPGALFGRYEVGALIGTGGMADVYEAVHVAMKKRVALKILREEVLYLAHSRERFVREGEAAARIQHPNVVDIFDVGTFAGLPYLVMERLEGESLADVLDREWRLEVQQLLQIVLPVCAGVAAGHDRGVIHRDLKPENIFLSTDGRRRTVPKVLDFGVSRVLTDLSERLTLDTSVLGTPYYMSPEQARGERTIDARTDQYSLGVIIYEAAVGRLPRDNPSVLKLIHEVACGGFQAPRVHNPDLSPEFEAVILRAMSDEPKDRYESIRALGAALLPFASLRAREYWGPEFAAPSMVTPMPQTRVDFGAIATPGIESINPSLPQIEPANLDAPRPMAPSAPTWQPEPARPRRRLGLVTVLALICAGVAAWRLLPRLDGGTVHEPQPPAAAPAEQRTFEVSLRVVPSFARIELDGNLAGTGSLAVALPADGSMHTIRVVAADHETQVISFRDAPPPPEITLRAAPRDVAAALPSAEPSPVVAAPASRRGSGSIPRHNASARGAAAPPAPSASAVARSPAQQPAPARSAWPAAPTSDNRNPWSNTP